MAGESLIGYWGIGLLDWRIDVLGIVWVRALLQRCHLSKRWHLYDELIAKAFFLIFEQNYTATMHSLNTILKEIKDVPVNRLEEVYQFVRSLIIKKKPTESTRNKVLSFGGAFSDMSDKDYAEYLTQTQKTRTKLFDRNPQL